jgi:hypothetical protein
MVDKQLTSGADVDGFGGVQWDGKKRQQTSEQYGDGVFHVGLINSLIFIEQPAADTGFEFSCDADRRSAASNRSAFITSDHHTVFNDVSRPTI